MNSVLWILRTTLMILFILVLVVGLTWGGYLAFSELQRSLAGLATRTEANESRISLLRSDVNNLVENNPDTTQQSEINNLQQQVTNLDNRLDGLQTELTADLAAQQQRLIDLEASLTAVSAELLAHQTQLTTLQDSTTAQQQTLDATNGRLDTLGTQTGQLHTDVTALQDTAITQEDLTTQMAEVQQTLTLFRVWQLITRARLRLVENNVGLATADVELALRTMDALNTVFPDADNSTWQLVQARLALAFLNLPDEPDLAATDLEMAWDELDAVLTERIGIEIGTAVPTAVPAILPTPTP